MRIVKLAGAASVLLAAHVLAQSTVKYTLELSPFKADYVSRVEESRLGQWAVDEFTGLFHGRRHSERRSAGQPGGWAGLPRRRYHHLGSCGS